MTTEHSQRWLRNLKRLRMLFFDGRVPRAALEEMRAMRVSYSQFGEDLVVHSHFGKATGLFVDVGAYHPFKYSNTKLLSLSGWRGVNIDCDPEKIVRFEKLRPQDHNVCAAISDTPVDLLWLHYSQGTTDRIVAVGEKNRRSDQGEEPLKTTPVRARPLTEILDASPFHGQRFRYLNIDCEGHDLAVLRGLDFQRYAPELITVEALTEAARAGLTAFLEPLGYRLTDIVRLTLFYKKCAPENSVGAAY
jgi:FkbM family methyltransferase